MEAKVPGLFSDSGFDTDAVCRLIFDPDSFFVGASGRQHEINPKRPAPNATKPTVKTVLKCVLLDGRGSGGPVENLEFHRASRRIPQKSVELCSRICDDCRRTKTLGGAMPTQPQPAGSDGPPLAPGPITPSDMRTLFTAVGIYRSLGGLEKAVDVLEITTKSNVEKIEQLTHKTDHAAFAIPILENAISRHTVDLNELGKDVHTARTIGKIALSIALSGVSVGAAAYLYHRLAPILFSK